MTVGKAYYVNSSNDLKLMLGSDSSLKLSKFQPQRWGSHKITNSANQSH